MPKVSEIITYCDKLLNVDLFKDYAPNGLQVEGKPEVQVLVSGVTANQALIDKAVELNADMLLVHHGYFWKGEDPVLVGMKGRRIKSLMINDINLVGYHLPLDGHAEFGNNAQLGQVLGLKEISIKGEGHAKNILFTGSLDQALSGEEFAAYISKRLNREPMHIAGSSSDD